MQPIISVMALGMAVLMPIKGEENLNSMWNNIQPGTSVLFQLSAADGYAILGLNEKKSKIIKFTDDRGTDMTPKNDDSNSFSGKGWLNTSMFNKNSQTLIFSIYTQKYASPDAKNVNIEAKLSVKVAKGEKSSKAAGVTLSKGTKFEIDKVQFTITNVNQTKDWQGKDGTEITFQYKKQLDNLKRVAFKNPATGKEMEANEAGSSSFSFNGMFTGDKTFRIMGPQPAKTADIEMIFYEDLRNEKVNIKQTVSLAVQGQKESKKMSAVLIEKPSVITAAGQPPKTIEEFIGMVNSKTPGLSIARMKSPAGWCEPAQKPEFDEYTLVLSGELTVKTDDGEHIVKAGQAIIVYAGERVVYSTPKGAEYIAVCQPAFSPKTVHRE